MPTKTERTIALIAGVGCMLIGPTFFAFTLYSNEFPTPQRDLFTAFAVWFILSIFGGFILRAYEDL